MHLSMYVADNLLARNVARTRHLHIFHGTPAYLGFQVYRRGRTNPYHNTTQGSVVQHISQNLQQSCFTLQHHYRPNPFSASELMQKKLELKLYFHSHIHNCSLFILINHNYCPLLQPAKVLQALKKFKSAYLLAVANMLFWFLCMSQIYTLTWKYQSFIFFKQSFLTFLPKSK